MSGDSVRSSKSPSWLFPYICTLLHLRLRRQFRRFWEATVLVCHIFIRQRKTPWHSEKPFSGDAKCREGMIAVSRILDLFVGGRFLISLPLSLLLLVLDISSPNCSILLWKFNATNILSICVCTVALFWGPPAVIIPKTFSSSQEPVFIPLVGGSAVLVEDAWFGVVVLSWTVLPTGGHLAMSGKSGLSQVRGWTKSIKYTEATSAAKHPVHIGRPHNTDLACPKCQWCPDWETLVLGS